MSEETRKAAATFAATITTEEQGLEALWEISSKFGWDYLVFTREDCNRWLRSISGDEEAALTDSEWEHVSMLLEPDDYMYESMLEVINFAMREALSSERLKEGKESEDPICPDCGDPYPPQIGNRCAFCENDGTGPKDIT